jgi:hypothetical protein
MEINRPRPSYPKRVVPDAPTLRDIMLPVASRV